MATLLHAGLVLGAAWFWTLRPPDLRPVFQGGDVSLAVTFVAAGQASGALSVERGAESVERRAESGERGEESGKWEAAEEPAPDAGSLKPVATDVLTDPEAEMQEDVGQTTDGGERRREERGEREAEIGERKAESGKLEAEREQAVEEEADQDVLDSETAVAVSNSQNGNQASKSAGAPSDAFSQGVSGAVRMQSEIRPYYPLGARLRGEEGAVTVRVWVNSAGRALRCEVANSSGFPVLDEAAVDAARRARYVSTRPGVWHAEAETTLTFRFQLKE